MKSVIILFVMTFSSVGFTQELHSSSRVPSSEYKTEKETTSNTIVATEGLTSKVPAEKKVPAEENTITLPPPSEPIKPKKSTRIIE
jgi:hypothetical protein